ncbi:VirB4-like conjugal transfer ATPase, CD1110 family (plasmid) [Clostridium perfringens]|uniref:VirB4-like conjugal transfer ATPase, CD1110 family n=1 Tax=Clostridium perfringens TaxID=1502 RepID=UPI002246FF39|nr:ATP-binding protein [Clostridium perfringens]MCX0386714.1 ATP-binding protein [Clostridium perfringens]
MFKKNKKEKEKKRIPRTVQQTIPYINHTIDGIFEVEKGRFSKAIEFEDVNYQIAKQDDQERMFLQYCNFLNYYDSNVELQINITNKNINKAVFEDKILLKKRADGLDEYREEFNDMLKFQMLEGKNSIKQKKSIVLTLEAKDFDEARKRFSRYETEITSNFKKIGSKITALNCSERLEELHDFLRVGKEGEFVYDEKNFNKKGVSTKDLICPDSFEFKSNYFMIGDKYARAVFIRDFPTFLNDGFISELTDIPKNLMLNINIKSVEPEKALRIVQKQITGMESDKIVYQKRSLKEGCLEAFIPHELKNSLKEAEELLDDLMNKNQKMFLVNIVLVHLADSKEELDKDTNMIDGISRKFLCQMGVLKFQQEEGFKAVLPLGYNKLKIFRTLTSESTAVLIPFNSQELIQNQGMYYGKNAVSKNLLMFNRKSLKNPNGFILGTPGSGKSFSGKREMVNVLLNTDDDVIVIDPEREYAPLVDGLKEVGFSAELIHISAGSKNYINPLDLTVNYSDDDDPLLLKSEFMLSLCECLIGGKSGLNAKEKTIIDRCVKKTYMEYLSSDFDESKVPTLKDFQAVLEQQTEKEAKDLAVALELYTKGSLSIFANKTNVNTNSRFIVYDIKDLGKQLKTMGLLIVLDAVWNRITKNRAEGRRTWFYIDEIYLLFANEYSANFLFELYKRARKWGGIPTGITQNVEDLLQSELARKMLSNSDFLLMLNQAPVDREQLANLLNISDTQLSYVTNSDEGEGLLFSGNAIIPFVDKFPKKTKLYKMMTTKVDEIKRK